MSQQRFYHYTIAAELSHDEQSITYLAFSDAQPEKEVSLKVFQRTAFADQLEQQHTLQVAETIKNLQHPSLVPVLEVGIEEEQVYIASAHMAGGSLRVYMDRAYPQTLPFQQILRISSQIGQALAALHTAQIVHGHLRPDGILFDANGQAFLEQSSSWKSTFSPLDEREKSGYNARYYAPEQFLDQTEASSDQYALCCIMYELLTGQPPLTQSDLASLEQGNDEDEQRPRFAELPPIVDAVVLRGLAQDPTRRHADLPTLLNLLQPAFPHSSSVELPLPRSKRTTGGVIRAGSSPYQTLPEIQVPQAPSRPATRPGSSSNRAALPPTPPSAEQLSAPAPSRPATRPGSSSNRAALPPKQPSEDLLPALSRNGKNEEAPALSVQTPLSGPEREEPFSLPVFTPQNPQADMLDNNLSPAGGAVPESSAPFPAARSQAASPAGKQALQERPDARPRKTPVSQAQPLASVDEASLLLAASGASSQRGVDRKANRTAKVDASVASPVQQPVRASGEKEDDSGSFDALLADLSHQEELFLAAGTPPKEPSQELTPSPFGVKQSAPSTGSGASPANKQAEKRVLQASAAASSPRGLASRSMGQVASGFASLRSARSFRPGWSRGRVPRPLLWAAALIFLVGSLITYLVLASIPASPTALHVGSSTTTTKQTTGDQTTLGSLPTAGASPSASPNASPSPGSTPSPSPTGQPTAKPTATSGGSSSTSSPGSGGSGTGSGGSNSGAPPAPAPTSKPTPRPTAKPATSSGPPAQPSITYYYVVNRFSGKVLSDTNWSTASGAPIQQWTKESGESNQQWEIVSAGGGYSYIMNRFSGKILDDTDWSTASGALIQQWTNQVSQANQQWSFVSVGSGYSYIVNRFSGKVLDDTDWSTADGAQVQQWTEQSGQTNQEWALVVA